MNRKIILLLGVLVLTGCSKETVKENNNPNPDQPFVSNDGKLSAAESKFIDGSILEKKGQLDEAIGKYIEAARIDPQPGIYYSIAKNYYRLNKLPSSLSYAKKAVSGDSGNVEWMENSSRLNMPVKKTFHVWGFAWECKPCLSNLPVMYWV